MYDITWDAPLVDGLRVIAASPLPRIGHLVDLGCGTGLLSRAPAADTVTGVDTSSMMLRRARLRGRLDHAVVADAADTGLADGTADAVLSCNLLQFHPDPAAVVREALRLVRPRGRVVLSWPRDRLTIAEVYRVERRLGRRRRSAALASVLRRLIACGARMTLTARATLAPTHAALAATVRAVARGRADVTDLGVHVECQQVVLLVRHDT